MCGIAGAIGKNYDQKVIRTLLLCNSERGNEATGFFSSDMKIWKRAQSPIEALCGAKLNRYLSRVKDNWFLALHTRLGTRGSNSRANAHPFRYGKYIGSHNGIVDAPYKYDVDSMYLIDSLAKCNGDYQKALAEIDGYWSISWTDGKCFYLQAHRQTLAYTLVDGVYYYTSDKSHLRAALGDVEIIEFTEGQTLRFAFNEHDETVTVSELPKLEHAPEKWQRYDYRTQGKGYWCNNGYDYAPKQGSEYVRDKKGIWHHVDSDLDAEYKSIVSSLAEVNVPDYDERWMECWREYANEYE